jgi:copper chaperone CopZ
MKIIHYLFFLVILFSACNFDSSQKKSEPQVLELTRLEIVVEGMTCEGCENTVQEQLKKIEGVSAVSASHVDEIVIVEADTSLSKIDALEEAINSLGYTVIK